jgi:hypothetical protein
MIRNSYKENESMKRNENSHTRQRIVHISNTLSGRNEQLNQLSVEIPIVLTSFEQIVF